MSLESLMVAAISGALKFIFVGGKGGVGKTTTSSAIAALLATACHKNVLLVSTDPAHSLGDAWRTEFSNTPKSLFSNDVGGSLEVMEIDPSASMEAELTKWASFAKDLVSEGEDDAEDDTLMAKIKTFQEWLSGIPGIDEATALSNAIQHIESGRYDIIVFDTAPTGHTLKLLALPDILSEGIKKLQGWQTTMWTYWEAFKGFAGSGDAILAAKRATARTEVEERLTEYRRGIEKVASMLQDVERTRFVVVCIAEYLSVSETRRLLIELDKNKVTASHVVVNQLVIEDALTTAELARLEEMAELGNLQMNQKLLQKTVHACRLTTARKEIQSKYLKILKEYPETQTMLDGIVEVPLLAEEVTGNDAILRFSKLLFHPDMDISSLVDAPKNTDGIGTGPLYECETTEDVYLPRKGDEVTITALFKSTEFNGLTGQIMSDLNTETGRYTVSINYDGSTRKIAMLPSNLIFVKRSDIYKDTPIADNTSAKATDTDTPDLLSDANISKAKSILQDPEIMAMIAKNPKVADAVKDVMENPMNFMKYLGDPELSPFLTKAMSKLSR